MASDRRRHARHAQQLDLVLVGEDGSTASATSVDVSLGGMRVRTAAHVPPGPLIVVLDDNLALHGEVREEVIDLADGSVDARITFVDAPPAHRHELAERIGAPSQQRRARVAAVVGSIGLVALVVAAGLLATNGDGPADPPPAPAVAATTTERADATLTVTIADDPAQSTGRSAVGPSTGFDPVRVQVLFEPDPAPDGRYRVAITIENRGDTAITFGPGGTVADVEVVDASGATVAVVPLRDRSVEELAPSGMVVLDGAVRLEPGTYTLDAVVELAAPAADRDD